MKSQKRRIEKLESKSVNVKEDVPANLAGIYAWEDGEDGQSELDDFYNPNKKYRPRDS